MQSIERLLPYSITCLFSISQDSLDTTFALRHLVSLFRSSSSASAKYVYSTTQFPVTQLLQAAGLEDDLQDFLLRGVHLTKCFDLEGLLQEVQETEQQLLVIQDLAQLYELQLLQNEKLVFYAIRRLVNESEATCLRIIEEPEQVFENFYDYTIVFKEEMEKIKVGVVDLNNYAESILGARVEMVEVDSHAW